MTNRQFFMAVCLQYAAQAVDASICISRATAAVEAVKLVGNR